MVKPFGESCKLTVPIFAPMPCAETACISTVCSGVLSLGLTDVVLHAAVKSAIHVQSIEVLKKVDVIERIQSI